MFKKFNDVLAVLMIVLISALWVIAGTGLVSLSGEVLGATIAVFTLISQYYFRKAPPK